jgi:CBS domain-containing protein/sporulation protein YlmC with PRC-barrel domain
MVNKFHLPITKNKEPRLEELKSSLISVAGVMGRKIINQEGQELGTISDLVCRWDSNSTYPPLTGLVAKVAWRKVWISIDNIKEIKPTFVTLGNAKLDLREFKVRPGEVSLNEEILDHQLIDVDGARVVRASDLYIASLGNKTHLVGVDVGLKPLLRRLGPSSLRVKAAPDSVIDWATIQSFGGEDHVNRQLRLSANRQELRRMRPGELADLLEDLGRSERQELLNALTPDLAADAMEEMEPKQLEGLLRESTPEEGAGYLSNMEPDEAADALRDLDYELREDLLKLIPKDYSKRIKKVLDYDETSAGGIMTTQLFSASPEETVNDIKHRLKAGKEDVNSLNAIVIIDDTGKLLFDLPLIDLLLAGDNAKLEDLIKPPATVTVSLEDSLKEVAESLVETRSTSVVVTDNSFRPIGRIFADDLLDGLLPSERFHFPRLLSS